MATKKTVPIKLYYSSKLNGSKLYLDSYEENSADFSLYYLSSQRFRLNLLARKIRNIRKKEIEEALILLPSDDFYE